MKRYVPGIALVLSLWFVLALALASPVLPLPHAVLVRLGQSFVGGTWWLHWLSSLWRVLGGISLGLCLALPWGILAASRTIWGRASEGLLYLLNPLPKIAFLPLFMTLLGLGDLSKMVIIATVVMVPLGLGLRDGTLSLLTAYRDLALTLGLGRREVMTHIVMPGLVPRVAGGLRLALGMGLSVLFFSENFATSWGLGYAIMNSWIMADYTAMYGGIIILAITGAGLLALVDTLERKACPWRSPDQAETD